jgi:Flp pilus assembly protein TadG
MKKRSVRTERGQALIIMVFGMIALLAIAGLAIDGGTVLMERRHAQNAADAAALAGTRELARAICEKEGADDASILAQVIKLVADNNVGDPANSVSADYVDYTETVLGRVGDGTIPVGSTGISATVTINRRTYFLSMVGIAESAASAYALAVTGPLAEPGNVRPFGLPYEAVENLVPGDEITVIFKHDGGSIEWPGGQDQHRGWMNLAYMWNAGEDSAFPRARDESADAATLKELMAEGGDFTVYPDNDFWLNSQKGDFIHAKPGTNSSAVCQAPMDPYFFPVPVFDVVVYCPDIGSPKPDCPTQGSGFVYHIIGLATVKVTGCKQGQGEITLELTDEIVGSEAVGFREGMGFGEAHACETHTQAVTLWQ